jgi:hypothetical protein
MVLPAAIAGGVSVIENAATDSAAAIMGRFQRVMWNILVSPDVKLFKAR